MEGHIDGIEEQEAEQLKKLEESILSIITKIKVDRNRACLQNILTFLNRRGYNIEMEEMKNVIDDLISRNFIVDK